MMDNTRYIFYIVACTVHSCNRLFSIVKRSEMVLLLQSCCY